MDYPEAVADGKVKNADEYKEMLEFTAQSVSELKELPPNPHKDALVAAARIARRPRGGESRRRSGRRCSGEIWVGTARRAACVNAVLPTILREQCWGRGECPAAES